MADRLLSVDEVCAELNIARSTWNDWRAKRKAPKCVRLPNSSLRVRRSELDRWLTQCEDVA
jgi:predicted DNA-binding transcriptional regulator AlpA